MKLSNISQPFFIRLVRLKISIKHVFGDVLGIRSLSGASVVCILDRRLNVPLPTDPQYSFIVDFYAVIPFQIIPNPAVSFIR